MAACRSLLSAIKLHAVRQSLALAHDRAAWQMLSMRGPALPERPTVNSRGQAHDESVLIPRRIVGREGIGKLFEYRVEATARASFLPMIFDEDERTRIDLDRIAGTPIWLTIDLERVEDSRDSTRIVPSSSGAGVREINGIAVLISLSAFAGIASAQNAENGIQMSTDPACAAQIEEHARNVQAQPSTMQFDEASDSTRAPAQHAKGKHAHNAKHEKHEKSKSKAKKAHGGLRTHSKHRHVTAGSLLPPATQHN